MLSEVAVVRMSLPVPRPYARRKSTPTTQALAECQVRLASAERELRVQFTRIAQLQASVDFLLAALDGVREGGPTAGVPTIRQTTGVNRDLLEPTAADDSRHLRPRRR